MNIASSDFNYLRGLVREHTAIVIGDNMEYLAEARLSSVAFQEGIDSVSILLNNLRTRSFGALHRKVLDAMTNNETWFFRDSSPFEVLHQEILPALIARKGLSSPIRIWSAASSSGQEAYSIAMLIREHFTDAAHKFSIMGTDISTAILERARAGRYSRLEVNRGLPAKYLPKYFRRVGDEWLLSDEIKKMVTFREMNLSKAWTQLPTFDVVFLRNVLIYFDQEQKKEILQKVRGVMASDGYFFLGSAETTFNIDSSFQRTASNKASYYRINGQYSGQRAANCTATLAPF